MGACTLGKGYHVKSAGGNTTAAFLLEKEENRKKHRVLSAGGGVLRGRKTTLLPIYWLNRGRNLRRSLQKLFFNWKREGRGL